MKNLEIELESILPRESLAADTKEPQFRLTELKALMRSTFRELYYFKDIGDMKEKESALFGSTEKKSPISFKIKDIGDFSNKKRVKVKFLILANDYVELEIYIKLLIQSLIIGAIGRKSRKGYGSFKINHINTDSNISKCNLLQLLEGCQNNNYTMRKFKVINNKVMFEQCNECLQYPYVKNIIFVEIKKEYKCLLEEIKKLNHNRLGENFIDVGSEINKNILGNCSQKNFRNKEYKSINRFASPICISFWENNLNKYMIIKELNYNYIFHRLGINEQKLKYHMDYVDKYIDKLIKIGGGK